MAPFSKTKLDELWGDLKCAKSAQEKGKALEELICYYFSKIPRLSSYEKNAVDYSNSEEIDIAFFNERSASGLNFVDHVLLLECKNWSCPVGSNEVTVFRSKLKDRACSTGILIAANGVTGGKEELNAALGIMFRALASDGTRILIITMEELEPVLDTRELVGLLKRKVLILTARGHIT